MSNKNLINRSIITQDFFERSTPVVARDLIGKGLFAFGRMGVITETEAYTGADDPASHAFRGPTKRCQIMFETAGHSYIYLIYGMHFCCNIVTEAPGIPGAVLIRGIWNDSGHYDGPGKLCRYLGINKNHNGINLAAADDFFVFDLQMPFLLDDSIKQTSRIGIRHGHDKLWRYLIDPMKLEYAK